MLFIYLEYLRRVYCSHSAVLCSPKCGLRIATRRSDLIRVVRLRLAHWNIWILGRLDWIRDGGWKGLHWSPERVWSHVESPARMTFRKRCRGRRQEKRANCTGLTDEADFVNAECG